MKNRSGAHRTRLQRAIEIAPLQPVVAQNNSRRSQRDNFGVGGRIAIRNHAIPSGRKDLAIPDDNRADGYFALGLCGAGLVNRRT